MDKLSEYIPLLIIIVSVIISIIGKKKQPVKEVMLPEEVFPVPQSPLIREEPVPEKKIVKPVAFKVPAPEKKQYSIHEKSIEIQDIAEYESINIDLSEPDEMKKAIIYSEIFNRKNF
jgi:hypothetical protein